MDKIHQMIVFDMDGVLVDINSSWSWIHDHFGVNNDHSLRAYVEGEIDDEEFIRRDIGLWRDEMKDLDKNYLKRVLDDVPRMGGFEECMRGLDERGFKKAIISGGLRPLAERIGRDDFDVIMANDVEEDEDGLTGEGIVEVKLRDKGEPFERLSKRFGKRCDRCIAVGNSHIDAPMLEKADIGIAFNPDDEEVRKAGDIMIEKKDLSLILDHI